MCVGSTGGDRSVWMFAGHRHSTAEWGQELLPPPQKQHSMDPLPSSRAEGWRSGVPAVPVPFSRLKGGGLHSH